MVTMMAACYRPWHGDLRLARSDLLHHWLPANSTADAKAANLAQLTELAPLVETRI